MVTNVEFNLSHAALQLNQLHVKGGLLSTQGGDLLLKATVLVLLVSIVALHFLFHLEVLVGEGLADFLGLESDHGLKSFLLAAENVYLLSVHA